MHPEPGAFAGIYSVSVAESTLDGLVTPFVRSREPQLRKRGLLCGLPRTNRPHDSLCPKAEQRPILEP
jgi:hypothetical protein